MSSGTIKNIIIGVMAVIIFILTWMLFIGDSGRYCKPVGRRTPGLPDSAVSDSIRRQPSH